MEDAAIRALAVPRQSVQDVQPFLKPLPRRAEFDLHLDLLVARVEEMVLLARRHGGALPRRQHEFARRLGVDADLALFRCEGLRVGAVPMRRVSPARRHGNGQKGVFAVGLTPVFFKDGPVFAYGVPDPPAGVVGNARWDSGDIFGLDVAREFGIHIRLERINGRA